MIPQVSVIIPYLNAAAYLADAIASVRAQDLTAWEMLMVDDGSSDGSVAIVDEAAQADPRIRPVRHLPGGVGGAAAARNRGLALARGTYICFLDADDLFVPDKLKRQVALLEAQPDVAMVYGPTAWWHPDDPSLDWIERVGRGGVFRPPILLDRFVLMLRGPVPCVCAVLVRRSVIVSIGGFEERFRLYEDQTLWVKIMARYWVCIDTALTSFYRQHPASVSAQAYEAGDYDRLRPHRARQAFLDWTDAYLTKQGPSATTRRALRRARTVLDDDKSRLTPRDRAVLFGYTVERRARGLLYRLRRKLPGMKRR